MTLSYRRRWVAGIRRRIRRLVRRLPTLMRWWSAPWRAEPTYIIIGVHKCGTSSLQVELGGHPQVVPALVKEVHYFTSRRFSRIPHSFYRAHFPLRRDLAGPPARITGEATPGYVYSRFAAERIRSRLPDVRLLVVIRDPTQRAISHFHHELRLGRERRPLGETLRSSMATPPTAAPHRGGDTWLDRKQYAGRGLYARALAPWFELFRDDQLFVVALEQLVADPSATMTAVCDFLDIEPQSYDRPFVQKNASPRDDVDPDLIAELDEYYLEPNRELARLLRQHQPNRPLPPWLEGDVDDV